MTANVSLIDACVQCLPTIDCYRIGAPLFIAAQFCTDKAVA